METRPRCTRSAVKRRIVRMAFAALAIVSGLYSTVIQAHACTELGTGSSFWVRLTAPVSSYTAKRNMPVHGFLLQSPECDSAQVFPIKIPVEGRVVSAHRVGLGLWHETAALKIEFVRIVPEGAEPIAIEARVKAVDNARETVKNGVIHGIRSTDTPQGSISSRLKYLPSLHLYPDPFLLGYKMLFPVFPEPEILLEEGTDIEVELTRSAKLPGDLPAVAPVPALGDTTELVENLQALPERTFTRSGKEADVVNIVFVGPRTDLERAFHAAGWKQSEAVSKHAVMHQFYAFLAKTDYDTAPMSAQQMDGRPADLTLEKAFDSYEKRNHVRIWGLNKTLDGNPLWASAAVRETGATLSVRHKGFIHHVSGDLAEEQQGIVRDLVATGCVEGVGTIARPEMEHILQNATGDFFHTDGSLTVVRLKKCEAGPREAGINEGPRPKPGSRLFRQARREILTVRSDLWRANCIYAVFDLSRMSVNALRENSSHRAAMASFRQSTHPTPTITTSAESDIEEATGP